MSEIWDAKQDTSLSVFDETLDKAKEVRERFVRERERLLKANLAAAVRRPQLEAIWRAASEELTALEREHKQRIATERQRLQRQTFTLPSAEKLPPGDWALLQLSYRDALSRADQAPGMQQLADLLQRAEVTGDELLARAVAVIALEKRWFAIVEAYAATRPAEEQASFQAVLEFERRYYDNQRVTEQMRVFAQLRVPI